MDKTIELDWENGLAYLLESGFSQQDAEAAVALAKAAIIANDDGQAVQHFIERQPQLAQAIGLTKLN